MKKILKKFLVTALALALTLSWLCTADTAPGILPAQAAPSAAPTLPPPGTMPVTLIFPSVLVAFLGPSGAVPDPSQYSNVAQNEDGSISVSGTVPAETYKSLISSLNISVQSYILQYSCYVPGLTDVDYTPDFSSIAFYYDPASFTGIDPQICENILLLSMLFQSYLQYPPASNFTTITFIDSTTGQAAYAVDSGALVVHLQQLQAEAANAQ